MNQTNTQNHRGFRHYFILFDNWTGRIEAFIISWGIVIMAVNTVANVFARYLFSNSLYFTEELNEFLIIIITFIGLGYITRKGQHIRMSIFYDMLPNPYKRILMIVIALVTAVVMFSLTWYAIEYVGKIARRGRVTPALQFPLYLTYIWVIFGFALTGIQYVLTAVKNTFPSDENAYISFTKIDAYEEIEITKTLHLYSKDHKLDTDSNSRDSSAVNSKKTQKEEFQ